MRTIPTRRRRFLNFSVLSGAVFICIFAHLCQPSSAQQPSRDRQLVQPQKEVSQRRTALVIGNGNYQNAKPLPNPANDADDMATALRELDFDLIGGKAHVDQTTDQMKALILDFGQLLTQRGGVGLFYYAGHGIQAQGHNYLIPIDAKNLKEKTIEFDAVDLNHVLGQMDAAKNGFNIVILDACRSNPFPNGWSDSGQGLAQIREPEGTGTLIAYATSPGKVADDGEGRNGVYTSVLLDQMRAPGLPIEELFKRVRARVQALTKNSQTPWEASSLVGDFCFRGDCPPTNVKSTSIAIPTTGDKSARVTDPDEEFWLSIKNSSDPEDFRAYKKAFPNGKFIKIAENNLRRLKANVNSGIDNRPKDSKDSERKSPNDASTGVASPKLGSQGTVIGSSGIVPGLEGRLNPIFDSLGRTYLYADNIAIDGGKAQPVDFKLNQPFQAEDSKGNRFELTITNITDAGTAITYRRLDNSPGAVSVNTEIRIVDSSNSPIKDARVLIVFDDKTYTEAKSARDGTVHLKGLKRDSAVAFFAHPKFVGYQGKLDLRSSLSVQLQSRQNEGSIICANGCAIPGLDGYMGIYGDNNPFMYARHINIDGGKQQPYHFNQGSPFVLQDEHGTRLGIRVVAVIGSSALVEFNKSAGPEYLANTANKGDDTKVVENGGSKSPVPIRLVGSTGIAVSHGPVNLTLPRGVYAIGDTRGRNLQIKLSARLVYTNDYTQVSNLVSQSNKNSSHIWDGNFYYWRLPQGSMLLLAFTSLTEHTQGWVLVQKNLGVWWYETNNYQWAPMMVGNLYHTAWNVGGNIISINLLIPNSSTGWTPDDIEYSFGH